MHGSVILVDQNISLMPIRPVGLNFTDHRDNIIAASKFRSRNAAVGWCVLTKFQTGRLQS